MKDLTPYVVFAVVVCLLLALAASSTDDCERRGGVLVRPAFGYGYECVKGVPLR